MLTRVLERHPLRQIAVTTDLNKVPEDVLQQHKLQMDVVFQKNRKDRFDADFQYKVEKDFQPLESSNWDDDEGEEESGQARSAEAEEALW